MVAFRSFHIAITFFQKYFATPSSGGIPPEPSPQELHGTFRSPSPPPWHGNKFTTGNAPCLVLGLCERENILNFETTISRNRFEKCRVAPQWHARAGTGRGVASVGVQAAQGHCAGI